MFSSGKVQFDDNNTIQIHRHIQFILSYECIYTLHIRFPVDSFVQLKISYKIRQMRLIELYCLNVYGYVVRKFMSQRNIA